MELICKYCGKVCRNKISLAQHELKCKLNPNRKKLIRITNGIRDLRVEESELSNYPGYQLGVSNARTTKGRVHIHLGESDKLVSKSELDDYISLGWVVGASDRFRINKSTGRASTKEKELARREKISRTMRSNPAAGGVRKGSGRGKKGWYKEIYCDSSWELAYVIYHLDHGLSIRRYKGYLNYEYNGEIHKYYPDFVTNEGIIEIKGYDSDQWRAKISQNPEVRVVYQEGMKKYLDYVVRTYDPDYTRLYTEQSD